jgi:uncharacterized protein YbaR (Trm112 family)/SAM-dependent methyltransferase
VTSPVAAELLAILACPICRGMVVPDESAVACRSCAHRYPVVDGIPVMLRDPAAAYVAHENDLPVRPGYARWKERLILKSLTDAQIALDFGAGNQGLDDPCIVKMDLVLGPHIDVVGDVHDLPFRDGSIDFAFGGAVMEHLPRPHRAADELYRVLKPGGYLYADWNFLMAYHGYPHHYFNATLNGIGETFRQFTQIELDVGPGHGAAFAFRSILQTYLQHFRPQTLLEEEFAGRLREVLWFPLDDFDKRIPEADRFRVAVSGYVVGVKQPLGRETIVPEVVLDAWRASVDLQRRYPQPFNLALPDNVMRWAKSALGTRLGDAPRWSKRGPDAPWDRTEVESWPWELMDQVDVPPTTEAHQWALWFSRPLQGRLRESWGRDGVAGLVRCSWWSVKRTVQEVLWRFGRRRAAAILWVSRRSSSGG